MSAARRIVSLGWLLLGLAAVVGSFLIETTARAGGGRSLEAYWLAVAGLALLPQALNGSLGRVAARLASLLVLATGGWCALTRSTWLHHLYLRPWELAVPERALGLGLVVLQTLVVVTLLRRDRALFVAIRKRFDRRLFVVLALALLASAAHATLVYPHRDEPRYLIFFVLQLAVVAAMALINLGHLVLLAARLDGALLERATARLRAAEEGRGLAGKLRARLPLIAGVWVTAVSALISWFVLDRVPHVPDGIAYLFQAATIAGGSFSAPAPPIPEAFSVYLMDVRGGQWYAVTNPGFPLLLAIGVKIGCAWLVNPVLGGLSIFAGHGLLRRLLDRRRADLATIMLALSPWMIFLAASFMTHMATQLFAILGFIFALDAAAQNSSRKGLLAGAAFGFVLLVRPLDGLLLGVFAGLVLLAGWWRELRPRFPVLLAFGLGAVLVSSVLLVFSRAVTGSFLEPPINAYIADLWPGSTNRLGFGPEVGNPPQVWGPLDPIRGHGWRDVLLNSNQNLANLQMELFGWPIGSLALLLFLLARGRLEGRARAVLALLALLAAGYNLYWFSGGPDFGPRYWFSMILPLALLSVLGFDRLRAELHPAGARVGAALAALLLLVTPVFCVWRISARYLDYRGFHGGYRRLLEEHEDMRGGLVLVETREEIDYGCAFILNDPFLSEGSTIFARSRGTVADFELIRALGGRRVFRVRGPAGTGRAVERIDPRAR